MDLPEHTPPSGGPWCYPENTTGEAAAGNDQQFLAGMFSDYSRDDLFDLAWQQGGAGGDVMFMDRAVVSGHRKPPPMSEPEVLPAAGPPSENEMASWLSAIVRGGQCVPPSMTDKPEGMSTTKKQDTSGASRRRHQGEAHNLTEKKRRCKINERLKTLQQLVPGCDKSNHASTLEQTIQYLKWLKHQVQANAVDPPPVRTPAAATPAAYPVVQPPTGVAPVVLGHLPMVSYRPLLPCAAHYPCTCDVSASAAAAPPPLYPIPAAALPPATSGADSSHRHGTASSSVLKRGRN